MNKNKAIGLIVLLLLLSTGCWDAQDISQRAFVNAVVVDALDDNSENKYKITLEIIKPETIIRRDTREEATIIHTAEAKSIADAVEQIQARISRPISFGHIRLLIMGEEVSRRESIMNTLDYFTRHPDIAVRFRIAFVQGSEAREVLYAKPSFEKFMTAELVSMTQVGPNLATVRTAPFNEFIGNLLANKGTELAPRVLMQGKDEPVINNGGAVLRNWKLAGWLSAEETQGANWLIGNTNAVVVAQEDNESYTYRVNKQSAKIIPYTKDGELAFRVEVKTDGILRQKNNSKLDVSQPENLAKIESLFSRTINNQVSTAIESAQVNFKADYLGFGQALRRKDPALFKTLNWDQVFPTVPVDVEVKARVTVFGMTT